jgi:MFS family permease
MDAAERGKLDIGRVISQTFAVIGRNLLPFSALSLLLYGLPLTALSILQSQFVTIGDATTFNPDALIWSAYVGLASLITNTILQGALIYGTVQDLNGQRPSVGACLATGLRNFLPLIGMSILLGIGLFFGFLLLVVPGFILLVAWSVAAPALVADRTGVIGAFGRSAELTRGNRWRIFGLFIISWIILMVISMVFGAVMGASVWTAALSGDADAVQAAALSPLNIVVSAVSNTILALLSATGFAVLYVELRRLREGLGPQWLSDIFS